MASLHSPNGLPTRSVCKTMTPRVGRSVRATVWVEIGAEWASTGCAATPYSHPPRSSPTMCGGSRKKGARSVPRRKFFYVGQTQLVQQPSLARWRNPICSLLISSSLIYALLAQVQQVQRPSPRGEMGYDTPLVTHTKKTHSVREERQITHALSCIFNPSHSKSWLTNAWIWNSSIKIAELTVNYAYSKKQYILNYVLT